MKTFHIFKKLLVVGLIVFGLTSSFFAQNKKLTAEEILAKHLESVGTAEKRASLKSIMAIGKSKATFRGRGSGLSEGIVVVASEGDKNLVAMKFNNPDYPFEKMGYDGSDFTVGFVRPGTRSVLGDFLRLNENTFKYGILGGTLSTSWELYNFDEKNGKLKASGMEKIDGKTLYEVKYNPKKGSELNVTFFFDAENFHHVRTEYRRVIAARQGATIDSSAGQSETRYKLVEEFDNFKAENNLMLPHTYKLYLEILTGNGTTSYNWIMELENFTFNQEIDDKEFKMDTY